MIERLLPVALCCCLLACGARHDDGASGSSGLPADSRLRVAEAAEEGGNPQLALSMYLAAAESAPGDVQVQLRASDALARAGQYTQAKQLLIERLKADPQELQLMRGLGMLYLLSGEPGHGIQMFDLVLARKPNDAAAMADKGIGLDLLQRHAEAQKLYRQALAILPDDATISNDLALSMMLEGKFTDAGRVLEPFRGTDAPQRLTNNLDILHASEGASQPDPGGSISNDDVLSMARALHHGIDTGASSP